MKTTEDDVERPAALCPLFGRARAHCTLCRVQSWRWRWRWVVGSWALGAMGRVRAYPRSGRTHEAAASRVL
eukprot:scaffold137646_cov28-Tisochrysis_lutea.AAC.1